MAHTDPDHWFPVDPVPITGSELRTGDVITHPSGAFPPVTVAHVLSRDVYAVDWEDSTGRVDRTANLARLFVERAS